MTATRTTQVSIADSFITQSSRLCNDYQEFLIKKKFPLKIFITLLSLKYAEK